VTRHDPPYEPPAVEVVPTEDGPAITAAGESTYGAITLMDDDKRSGE
jgi:hypothetical protein